MLAQSVLDVFPDVVSQFGLIGCALFVAWLASCATLALCACRAAPCHHAKPRQPYTGKPRHAPDQWFGPR